MLEVRATDGQVDITQMEGTEKRLVNDIGTIAHKAMLLIANDGAKSLLYVRKATLVNLEMELMEMLNQVEKFIASVDDSRMRRIITLRFNDNLSWIKVAERLGGKSTADSVRMEFNRFMGKK